MDTLTTCLRWSTLVGVALLAQACSKGGDGTAAPQNGGAGAPAAVAAKVDFQVERFELGTAVDAEKKISAPAKSFRSSDTIYASVVGSGHATRVTLRTRWMTKSGRLIFDASQHIYPKGPTTTEFHSPSPHAWPAGPYRVDLTVDEQPAGSVEFTIAD